MFNSRYLEVADVAMTEFFRDLGWSYPELLGAGVDPSVVSVSMTFSAPARLDDDIAFDVTCSRVGRSSFELEHRVHRGADELAGLRLTYVNVDPVAAASRQLPGDIVAALESGATRGTRPLSPG
jgi:acyl-CoA thioester hydrolase